MSVFLRSLVFNVAFYVAMILYMIIAIPTFLMPARGIVAVAKFLGLTSNVLLRVICNIKVEYVGLEKIPQGPLLVASKHQSVWETFALLHLFDQPVFILKRELMWIPLFGWFARKGRMIPVDRGAGGRALLAMAKRAHDEVQQGRQLIIFPEGTRRPVGAEPRYKYGVAQIYVDCGVPCLPVALNSGLFWPRRTFLRFPGTIRVEILDLMPSNLSKEEFLQTVSARIEEASNRLAALGQQDLARNAA